MSTFLPEHSFILKSYGFLVSAGLLMVQLQSEPRLDQSTAWYILAQIVTGDHSKTSSTLQVLMCVCLSVVNLKFCNILRLPKVPRHYMSLHAVPYSSNFSVRAAHKNFKVIVNSMLTHSSFNHITPTQAMSLQSSNLLQPSLEVGQLEPKILCLFHQTSYGWVVLAK